MVMVMIVQASSAKAEPFDVCYHRFLIQACKLEIYREHCMTYLLLLFGMVTTYICCQILDSETGIYLTAKNIKLCN